MKKIINRAATVLGCVLTLFAPQFARPATTAGQRLEIDVCEIKVPKELAQANATFTITYAVQVGEDGHPMKVEKVKNDFLPDEPFAVCLKSWTLPTANRRLAVSFTWKHAQGWAEIAITGEDFSYRIVFKPGAFAQYRSD
jgi:hypothetical protein